MWFRRKPKAHPLAETLRILQANRLEKDPGFLKRLSESMDKSPEPYQWIFMLLQKRLRLLENRPVVAAQDNLLASTIQQAELRAEVRLLRSLSQMAVLAGVSLDNEKALSQTEFEAAETENS